MAGLTAGGRGGGTGGRYVGSEPDVLSLERSLMEEDREEYFDVWADDGARGDDEGRLGAALRRRDATGARRDEEGIGSVSVRAEEALTGGEILTREDRGSVTLFSPGSGCITCKRIK